MSHLACADEPDHLANAMQLALFQQIGRILPCSRMSLAASSGIFLGPELSLRSRPPGRGPVWDCPSGWPAQSHAAGRAPSGQGDADPGCACEHAGRLWPHGRITSPSRLATVAVGYADGFLRSLSGRGGAWFNGSYLPIIGRVSMDSIILDATALPAGSLAAGSPGRPDRPQTRISMLSRGRPARSATNCSPA